MKDDKWLPVAQVAVTIMTLICSVAGGIVASAQMKGEVADQVAKQMSQTTKESI